MFCEKSTDIFIKSVFISIILTLTIVGLSASSALARPVLTIESNETVGLLRFVLGICEIGKTSRLNVLAYAETRGGVKEDKAHIENVKKIFNDLPQSFDIFPDRDLPPSEKIVSFIQLLYYNAATARDFQQFKFSLYSIMPFSHADMMAECLDHFKPVYKSLHCAQAEKPLAEYLKKSRNDKFIDQLQRFYGVESRCPEIKAIIVPVFVSKELYDKYSKSLSALSENFGNLQIIEVLFLGDKFADPFDTIVHEVCHRYYEMSQPIKAALEKIQSFDSAKGVFCTRLLNEALATAIGNGYFGGCDAKARWYEDELIDEFAKAIMPIIRQYMDSRKSIGEKFQEELFAAFTATFVNVQNDMRFLLYNVHIISSIVDTKMISREINRKFYSLGYESFGAIDHPKTIKNFKKSRGYTQLFVINKKEIEALKPYDLKDMDGLKEMKIENPVAYFNYDEKQKCSYLLFICENINEFNALFKKISDSRILKNGMQI